MFFSTRVVRCCFGKLTETYSSELASSAAVLALLQRRHDRSHVAHADLRIVARLRQIARGPAQHGGRAGADRDLVLAAFDALQHFKGAVVAKIDLVDALELVGDAETLADLAGV